MRKFAVICCLALFAMAFGQRSFAQESAPAPEPTKASQAPVHFYHLEFVVQELGTDGKPVNSRAYTVDTNTDRSNRGVSVRTGSRVPISTGEHQIQYIDLGVNFDVHNTYEVEGKLALELTADVSSLANPGSASQSSTPVIRNNRWQSPGCC